MGRKNNHEASYGANAHDAAKEAKEWAEAGGKVEYDGPHKGNSSGHYHLYDDSRQHDFVINVDNNLEAGSGLYERTDK